jgi:hypothetical protein
MSSHGWFRRLGLRNVRAAAKKQHPFRTHIEQLEDRCVPSAAPSLQPVALPISTTVPTGALIGDQPVLRVPALTYSGHKIHIISASRHNHIQQDATPGFQLVNQGGPVLANVEVETVYMGDYWNTTAGQALAKQIDGFYSYITSSPYMGILSQYGVNPGTFTGETVIPNSFNPGDTLDDTTIQGIVQQAISSGTLAAPDANTLYAIYTPPNVQVTLDGDSSLAGLLGYHSSFTGVDNSGNDFTASYSVAAHPTGNTPIAGLSLFSDLTAVSSHELAEAVTDPQPLDNPTWIDPNTGQEVGDPGEGQFGILNGYTIQSLWSNNVSALVLPTGAQQSGITVSVPNLQATAGTDFSGTIATFQDPTGGTDPTVYQAVIDWGDGTTSLGSITFTATPAAARRASHSTHHGRRTDNAVTFTVSGDHIYDNPGTYPVSVQITRDDGNSATGKGTAKVTGDVPSNDLLAIPQNVYATSGNSFTANVAAFSDLGVLLGNQNGDPSNYTATIDWGDGSTSTGTILSNELIGIDLPVVPMSPLEDTSRVIIRDGLPQTLSGEYVVQGTHTYANEGDFTITVTITRNDGANTSTASNATVAAAPSTTLAATGQDITEQVGASFTDTVATFIDLSGVTPGTGAFLIGGDGTTHTYTASIDWGDGSTSAGTVLPVDSAGDYLVQGTHSYSTTDNFTITVMISRDDGASTTVTSTATIVPAFLSAFTATGVDVTANPGVSFTGTVATISETPSLQSLLSGLVGTANQPGATNSYTATIDWGDGSTSTATIVAVPLLGGVAGAGSLTLPPLPTPSTSPIVTPTDTGPASFGQYQVQGTHTYANTGTYTITVTISDGASNTATATSTATVAPPLTSGSLTVNVLPITGTAGTDIAGDVATFTDTSASTVTPNGCPIFNTYTATINWGDGTTSIGLVVPTYCPDPVSGGTGNTGAMLPFSVTYYVFDDHTYAQAGSYNVTVTITGPDGDTGSGTNTATISAA